MPEKKIQLLIRLLLAMKMMLPIKMIPMPLAQMGRQEVSKNLLHQLEQRRRRSSLPIRLRVIKTAAVHRMSYSMSLVSLMSQIMELPLLEQQRNKRKTSGKIRSDSSE